LIIFSILNRNFSLSFFFEAFFGGECLLIFAVDLSEDLSFLKSVFRGYFFFLNAKFFFFFFDYQDSAKETLPLDLDHDLLLSLSNYLFIHDLAAGPFAFPTVFTLTSAAAFFLTPAAGGPLCELSCEFLLVLFFFLLCAYGDIYRDFAFAFFLFRFRGVLNTF
jgi:hypothetical protein